MELNRTSWQRKDIDQFLSYLQTFKRSTDKCKWEQGIINTKYECLGILTHNIKTITKEIAKGNYLEFLDLQIYDNYPSITIMGNLICKIKDFEIQKHYLDLYSEKVDNWANCDQLKFTITKDNQHQYLKLVEEYINSPLTFRRRIALIILFKFITPEQIDMVFKYANSLFSEQEYYVNMANAWLLCECFIKCRKETLEYLKEHNLNNFTINKMISKCRDSFRVSKEDKDLLNRLYKSK